MSDIQALAAFSEENTSRNISPNLTDNELSPDMTDGISSPNRITPSVQTLSSDEE